MRLLLVSLVLFLACAAAFIGAAEFSHLAADVVLVHRVLTAACWFFFLLSLALAVIASTTGEGRLHAPRSLPALLCWALLIPQAGFAVGRLVNYRSSLEMMLAVSNSPGADVLYIGDGELLLDGEIGTGTLASLLREIARNEVRFLRLRSGGGLIPEAEQMGSALTEHRIPVLVDGDCASACVIVALSPGELYVSPDARFGFHRGSAVASPESGLGRFVSRVATDQLITRLRRLGVPEPILLRAQATPPDAMYYVSGREFHEAGLALLVE